MIYKTAIITKFCGLRQLRSCMKCMLIVDSKGKPDPTYYNAEQLEAFAKIPEDQLCGHLREVKGTS
jgi:hypothetical protein